jgi:hypothetical protein
MLVRVYSGTVGLIDNCRSNGGVSGVAAAATSTSVDNIRVAELGEDGIFKAEVGVVGAVTAVDTDDESWGWIVVWVTMALSGAKVVAALDGRRGLLILSAGLPWEDGADIRLGPCVQARTYQNCKLMVLRW